MIVYADLATRSSALNPELDFIDIDESRPRTDCYVAIFLDGLHRGLLHPSCPVMSVGAG